jgi:GTP-binding protein
MVDVEEGLHSLDEEFARVLRRSDKPIFIVANKADTNLKAQFTGDFYALGLGEEIYPVSSASGSGTGDLLDEVVKHFQTEDAEDPDAGIPKLAVVGRPNVGKSSFVNLLLGEERNIVTDIAGTTRDSINSRYNAFGMEFIITDTAGLRRKTKVHEDIEFYSVLRSIRAIEESDVCIVMLDATRGLEAQDMNIVGLADKNRKGIVILVNKWDLVEKETNTMKEYEEQLREKLAPLTYMPIIFTSVLTKQRVHKAIETAYQVYKNKTQKISTSKLNDVILKEIEAYPPPAIKGKFVKIKYITQLPTHNPTFAFFCNLPQYIKESYTRFLENKIRKNFGFEGVPINVVFRKK